VELAMAFVVEVAAGAVVAVTANGGNVGRVDAGAVVGMIGSCVGGCALETCSAGWRGAGGTGRTGRAAASRGNRYAHEARREHGLPVVASYKTAALHSARTWLLHRSAVRAVLKQQASGVLDLPGGVQDDVHATGILDKSIWRLHVQSLSERFCYRQFSLASIAKDAHDPAGFNHYRSP
jgi:hypothetical protein